jgi:parvulin-like peptidyl-prolyl isomerase
MLKLTASALLTPVLLALGCADLTAPSAQQRPAAGSTASPSEAAAAATAVAAAAKLAEAPKARPSGERVGASHVLIAYKGSRRARPEITRSKEDARKIAEKIRDAARKGQDFGQLAVDQSDDPTAKQGRGSLGSFDRESMVKPFADAAFALQPGQVSDVVETDFGFHVIKRD